MNCKSLKFTLNSGNKIPAIGFGTYRIRGTELIREVLDYALAAGYRCIDTAAVYGNEKDINKALKELLPKYSLKREDIFITSKLSPNDHGNKALLAVQNSLKNLDCGYLDLYLIHWPGVAHLPANSPENTKIRALSWKALIQAKEKGYVRDIGISNYTVKHLDELLANCHGVKPVVNQVEWHPNCHPNDLKELCEKENILLQAYSSLGGTDNPVLMSEPSVKSIAKKLDKSPAQVLLRWAIQQNIAIIPKARSKSHIDANIDLNFDIPNSDMDILNKFESVEHYAWDPNSVY